MTRGLIRKSQSRVSRLRFQAIPYCVERNILMQVLHVSLQKDTETGELKTSVKSEEELCSQ